MPKILAYEFQDLGSPLAKLTGLFDNDPESPA